MNRKYQYRSIISEAYPDTQFTDTRVERRCADIQRHNYEMPHITLSVLQVGCFFQKRCKYDWRAKRETNQ